MGCGCADRMREILTRTGYVLEDGEWRKDEMPTYRDADVEERHAEIAAQVGAELLMNTIESWLG